MVTGGQTRRFSGFHAQDVGVARVGRGTGSDGKGRTLAKSLGEPSHSLFAIPERGRWRPTVLRNGQSLHLQKALKYYRS